MRSDADGPLAGSKLDSAPAGRFVHSSSEDALITLRGTGRRRPIFTFHPGVRSAFRHLAQSVVDALDPEIPVYAVDPKALDGMADSSSGVSNSRNLADLLMQVSEEAVLRVQPDGPYVFAGWSAGAVVALGLAQRLNARGEQARVVALDARVPSATAALCDQAMDVREDPNQLCMFNYFARDIAARAHKQMPVSAESFRPLSLRGRAELLLEHGRKLGLFSESDRWQDVEARFARYTEAMKRSAVLARAFEDRKSNLPVLLVRAAESIDTRPLVGPSLGWERITDDFRVLEVPGDHFSCLLDPGNRLIAEGIERWLSERGT